MNQESKSEIIKNRYDFVYLFDCKDGNPNGDPDMDNTPRFDPETFQGIVSDVCLKRKIRDYVFSLKSKDGKPEPGYDVFVLQGLSLESRQKMPYENLSELDDKGTRKDTRIKDSELARDWMCENFFDVRAFGAVMSTTDFNCGQVRGPVQITFARSFDRVMSTMHGITRLSHTTQKDQDAKGPAGTMGHKHTIAYGLYQAHGFINPFFAETTEKKPGTGFTEADLEILWQALLNMFDLDRSAARGLMACRGLYIFKHESKLGNAPAHKLFERVSVKKKAGVEVPRSFADYEVTVVKDGLPAGVELIEKM